MTSPPTRRRFLALGLTGTLGAALPTLHATADTTPASPGIMSHRSLERAITMLERRNRRTIGVVAADRHGNQFRFRAGERFPMCSLFKTLLVGALLRNHAYDDALWSRRIRFSSEQIVVNSPICSVDPDRQLSVAELADAALRFSDNTAGNLLLDLAAGPATVTAFATRLGADRTRLDRWEPELNEGVPGDPRDTSTPTDIHKLYRSLLVGDALDRLGQARLRSWMLRNTTSGERLRRALPPGAELADKTGAGDYGVVNDAGVFWRGDDVLSVAVLTRADTSDATNDNTVVAQVGQLLVDAFLA